MTQSTGAPPSNTSTPTPLPQRDTTYSSYPGASTYRQPAATTQPSGGAE